MTDPAENVANPYAPPAVPSVVEEAPPGMEFVVEDRELASYLKIRKQTPMTCLLCVGAIGFWTSFIATLFGALLFFIPAPPEFAVPLLSTTAALAAGTLTAVPLAVIAALRPRRRFAISAIGLVMLSAGLAIAASLWVTVAILFEGPWRESIGILLWTGPLWFFLPFGLLGVWVNRYAVRRLAQAGISETAITLKGGRIYDFPR